MQRNTDDARSQYSEITRCSKATGPDGIPVIFLNICSFFHLAGNFSVVPAYKKDGERSDHKTIVLSAFLSLVRSKNHLLMIS